MDTSAERSGRARREKNVMVYRNNRHFPPDVTACAHARDLSHRHLRHRGIALVWTVILLMLMILLIGLSLDTAKVALVLHQLHNAADAAALAGGRVVKTDPNGARAIAQFIAQQNFADHDPVPLDLNLSNDPAGDIVIGQYGYDRDLGRMVFVPADPCIAPVNALAVIASRNASHGGALALNFGPIAAVPTVNLAGWWQGKKGPYAIAVTAGGTGAGLICIRPEYRGLDIQGTSALTVNNDITQNPNDGAIQVNSRDDIGISINGGTPVIDAFAVNMCANDYTADPASFDFPNVAYVNYGQPPIPDPLAGLLPPPPMAEKTIPELVTPGNITKIGTGQNVTLSPGYYSGGWKITGGNVTLLPGIYILNAPAKGQKAGLYIDGGSLDASAGVMFYVMGNGIIYIAGSGNIVANPMTDENNPYQHITIFQARDNLQTATIIGTSTLDLNGTLYFPQKVDPEPQNPNATQQYALELGGVGDGFGNQIITDSMYIRGTSNVIINYDGRNPAPTTRAYLVE